MPLLAYLVGALAPMSRTRVKDCLAAGRILVNGVAVTRHDHLISPADVVALGQAPARDHLRGVREVYRDEAIVVVDKPAGLLTVATDAEKLDTLYARLTAHDPVGVKVVHRLDRDTSGLVLFARSVEVRDGLRSDWGGVEKTYLAWVAGRLRSESGRIESHLLEGDDLRVRAVPAGTPGAKWAASDYRVTAAGPVSRVAVTLVTGRKHQIRVHLASLGCPVVGDAVYGRGVDPAGRLGLHAWRLAFPHPLTGARLACEAAVPAELARLTPAGESRPPGRPPRRRRS